MIVGDYMGTKEELIKKNKKVKLTLKNIIYSAIGLIFLVYIAIFYNCYIAENIVLAKETSTKLQENLENKEELKISNAEKVNLQEIVDENSNLNEREEFFVEEIELEYITKYQNNSNLPKGMIQVIQEGRKGKQQITKKKVYNNDEFVREEQVSSKVTKASINKIVEIGTGKGKSKNYKVKVGDNLYVTSDRLTVRLEPNEDSEKMSTLAKNEKIKLLEMRGDWYKISSTEVTGYVKAESTISELAKNENYGENGISGGQSGGTGSNGTGFGGTAGAGKSLAQIKNSLSFNMALNKPSGLSLEQFKTLLTNPKDKNKVFQDNAEYFYYIEKQYNINGLFVAAVGIHESAWGTSKIARDKKNLFGYGAYDSNPYNGAYTFTDYSECIDLIARVFVKYYLNPKGTSIYGGEKAKGTYYNGPTLTGINTKYATDKKWANKVYAQMVNLLNGDRDF